MKQTCTFTDQKGTFRLQDPDRVSALYFPIANEAGMMSSVTPLLGGDAKTGQNTFLLSPVSVENLHNDRSTRNFWVVVEGYGKWSATGASARQEAQLFEGDKEEVTLDAGILWQKLTRTAKQVGLRAEVLSYCPTEPDAVELHRVTVTNITDRPLSCKPYAVMPLYARSADNFRDHRHVTSLLHRAIMTQYGVELCPTLTFDERGHRKNAVRYGAYAAEGNGTAPVGRIACVEELIGEGGSFANPAAIGTDFPHQAGETLDGFESVSALQFADVTLAPGESRSYIMMLGVNEKGDSLPVEKYCNDKAFEAHLQAACDYWQSRLNLSFHTGDETFDQWMKWVSFQPTLRRLYGCSFLPHHDYGRGGRGWRDLWQDCLALLLMDPDGVRDMLVNNFAGVRFDGTNATIIGSAPGEFIADRNNITRVWMDHGAWPLITVKLYLDRTGDLDFLLEGQTYFKDPQIFRGKKKDPTWSEEQGNRLKTAAGSLYTGSILEHLLVQNLTAFYNVGEHNMMLLDGADWNDGLDMAADRGESVAFTCLYCKNLLDLADLLDALSADHPTLSLARELNLLLQDGGDWSIAGKHAVAQSYYAACATQISGETMEVAPSELANGLRRRAAHLKEIINQTQWIITSAGSWFNSYYDNSGRMVEGDHENGVRMMLTGQVFAIMSGVAETNAVRSITQAADALLYDESVGGYRLNTDFKEVKTDLGRLFGFAFGHKENGAVFSHMTTMYSNALYSRGFAREGFKAFDTLYRTSCNFGISKIYPGIPEYFNSNGRGMYSFLTGAASWMIFTALCEMFGVSGKLGNLVLTPKLVKEQFDQSGKASVTSLFAGKTLTVVYDNPNHLDYGAYRIAKITLDGTELDLSSGAIIPASALQQADGEKHTVVVTLA